ncbi:hypothetical protein IWZ01DRAFT_4100 [Phyllosticta capitalensis]
MERIGASGFSCLVLGLYCTLTRVTFDTPSPSLVILPTYLPTYLPFTYLCIAALPCGGNGG